MAAASITSRSVRRRPLRSSTWPCVKSMPCGAHIAALGRGLLDGDAVAVARGKLLDHHGVAAGRHHAAGENARGLACFDLAVEGMAGGDFADDLQRGRRVRHVGSRARHSRPWRKRRPAAACAAPRDPRPARGRAHDRASRFRPAARRRLSSTRAKASATGISGIALGLRPSTGRICRRFSPAAGCPRCACLFRSP